MLAAGHADIVLAGHDHDLVVHYDGRRVLAESSRDAHYVTAIDLSATVSTTAGSRSVAWRPSFRIHDTSAVAPDVLRRVVITTPNARFDNDPRSSRFLVLEKSQAGTGPDLRAPVVVMGQERDRRRGVTGR